jgi:hypothetical protein
MSGLPGDRTWAERDRREDARGTLHDSPAASNVPPETDLLAALQAAVQRARERQGRA